MHFDCNTMACCYQGGKLGSGNRNLRQKGRKILRSGSFVPREGDEFVLVFVFYVDSPSNYGGI